MSSADNKLLFDQPTAHDQRLVENNKTTERLMKHFLHKAVEYDKKREVKLACAARHHALELIEESIEQRKQMGDMDVVELWQRLASIVINEMPVSWRVHHLYHQ